MTPVLSEGPETPRRWPGLVIGIVCAGAAAPFVLYWLLLGRIATVTPAEAKQLVQQADRESVAIVDVRPFDAFSAGHIEGAVSWPLDAILGLGSAEQLPPQFRGKTLLLVCDVGLAGRRAAGHLAGLGIDRAWNVRGGIQEWIRSAPGPDGGPLDQWRLASGRVVSFPFRQSPLAEQALAVFSFFLMKPIYTLLSLAVVILLWTSRSADLAALRWAMIWFSLGENACAVNYFVFKETSYLMEYLHSFGMLLCFGFAIYGVLEGLDARILTVSDPRKRCALLGLCAGCIKYDEVPCGARRVFCLVLFALIVLATMLPSSDWHDTSYNTLVFGEPYNYAHLRVYQQIEIWYCAAIAILFFAASLAVLLVKRQDPIGPAKILFAAGAGPLGFGALRMILGGAYDQNRVWYLFWEEATELLFVAAICFVLWIFRRKLLTPGS